ncbi:MAG: secretin N-terminal domain-containing protein [Candidatus Omnitrophica bacterium]|nr:secretin N-terminal domain-containing protein [Candidatus Omnitrophota bacterium]
MKSKSCSFKKFCALYLAFILTCPLGSPGVLAQISQDADKQILPAASAKDNDLNKEAQEERISLNLRNIEIIEALKFFSLKSGYNIVPTQKVSGRVTLNVENVAVKDVFDIMLRSNTLAYDKRGDIYNVMTEAEYKQLYGRNFFDTRQVKVFRLKYAIPEQAFSLLDALKSDIGRLLVESESGSVVIIDTPARIAQAQAALEAMEQKNSFKVFTLKYAKARDVEEQLKAQLDLKKVGMVKADERTNQVIVQTLPERMKNIEELIASLDKKTKAVLIDCKIIKIKLGDQLDKGIQWEGLFEIAKQYGMAYLGSYPFSAMTAGITSPTFNTRSDVYNASGQIGMYPFSGTTSSLNSSAKVTPGKNMHIGIVDGKRDFDVLVNYLQTLGKSKIIASPSLAVVNNQEAKIHIGERQAYITTTTTTGTTTSTVSEEVTYVDVGVRLSVTPTINDDGYITMKVKPEISSIIGTIKSSSNNLVPIIDTNTAETTVLAKDGSTIILGGLGREERAESSEGVPYLSNIPIIGFLFKNSTRKMERVELVIMITPIIFEGDKFVTVKDADKFPVKPAKKFDVFKPEVAPQQIKPNPFSAGASLPKGLKIGSVEGATGVQASDIALPFKEGVAVKGFKSYEGTLPRQEVNFQDKDAAVGKPSANLAVKGFKPYN